MKAAVVTRYGPPDVLKIMDVPDPVPGPEEVLLEVRTIGLNFSDVFARMGRYPSVPRAPFVPGIEVAGIVRSTGRHVRRFKKGDRVVAFTRQKGYAEEVVTHQNYIQRIPRRMSFREAAAFLVTYMTAFHGLVTLASLRKGERVLIHAAAGGVGTAAVQIARKLKAEVFAAVGSDEKVSVAEEQGAHHVVNSEKNSFADWVRRESDDGTVDVILDSIGGRTSREGLRLLAPMGRLVIFGFAAVTGPRRIRKLKALREILATPLVHLERLPQLNISMMGFNLYFLTERTEYLRSTMRTLMRWYEEGALRPVVGRVFPFHQVSEAHAFLQSRKSVGKVVLTVR